MSKWVLSIDYEKYTYLETYSFEQRPKETVLSPGVVCYKGLSGGKALKVCIAIQKTMGWSVEEEEEGQEAR